MWDDRQLCAIFIACKQISDWYVFFSAEGQTRAVDKQKPQPIVTRKQNFIEEIIHKVNINIKTIFFAICSQFLNMLLFLFNTKKHNFIISFVSKRYTNFEHQVKKLIWNLPNFWMPSGVHTDERANFQKQYL